MGMGQFSYPYPSPQMGYQQPQQQQQQALSPAPQYFVQGVRWVDSFEEAQSCFAPAGTRIMMMNRNSPTFYVKETDQNGIFQVREYTFSEVVHRSTTAQNGEDVEYVTRGELEGILEKWRTQNEPTVQPAQSARHAAVPEPSDGPSAASQVRNELDPRPGRGKAE